jgi:hypothetical protein
VSDPHGIDYEKTDVDTGAITRLGVVLAVVTVVSTVAVLGLFRVLDRAAARQDPKPPPLARYEPGRQPPEPRLQDNPVADVEALREEEHRILTSYGWVDAKAGVVRIPIEEAMRIVAERGVPKWPAAVASASPSPAAPATGARTP